MTHLFDVMSVDGKLYQVVSSFSIDTVAGNTDIVGDRDTWTLQDLQQAKEQLGENATIFGESDVKTDILYACVSHGVDGFIDWANKTCSFDSQEFIDMLNFANSFPKEFDWENYDYDSSESEYSRLRSGKQMLTRAYLYSFSDLQYQKILHGGNVSFVGYPTNLWQRQQLQHQRRHGHLRLLQEPRGGMELCAHHPHRGLPDHQLLLAVPHQQALLRGLQGAGHEAGVLRGSRKPASRCPSPP